MDLKRNSIIYIYM